MHKFEIPFNFDIRLLDFLKENIDDNWIEFIYMPPFKEDCGNARSHTEGVQKSYGTYEVPDNRLDYEGYIREIQKRGYKPAILFQQEKPISDEILKYYIDLSIDVFIVNSDELAIKLKSINRNYKVVASITKTLSSKDLWEKDLSMYDKIVLHFPFNRALSRLKDLPPFYQYTILLNSFCIYDCKVAKEHWYSTKETAKDVICLKGEKKDNIIYIPPEYVKHYEPYITSFKLQGREYPTHILTEEIYSYYKRIHNPLAGVVYNRVSPFNAQEYFNASKDMKFVSFKPDFTPGSHPTRPHSA